LQTRQAGARRFVSVHIIVPGAWTVHEGHQLMDRIEVDMKKALPNTTVFTHLESLEDPRSWDDSTLD
jgi:divalent metal cation (Fe/Co/Zn/Cd) transporter